MQMQLQLSIFQRSYLINCESGKCIRKSIDDATQTANQKRVQSRFKLRFVASLWPKSFVSQPYIQSFFGDFAASCSALITSLQAIVIHQAIINFAAMLQVRRLSHSIRGDLTAHLHRQSVSSNLLIYILSVGARKKNKNKKTKNSKRKSIKSTR